MTLKIQDLIDIEQFQMLQDRLNEIYSFPSAIIDADGNILTATAWQDICTKFHRQNSECEKECIKSDQYIASHLHEANPAVSYKCPHGLVDNATPIIIEGVHYGNFFTGQFFLEPPDLNFFRTQAKKYGFDEEAYLEAVKKVPIWTKEKLHDYLFFIKGLIEVISGVALKNLREAEIRKKIRENEEKHRTILRTAMDGFWVVDIQGRLMEVNEAYCQMSGYREKELLTMSISDLEVAETSTDTATHMQKVMTQGEDRFETRHRRKDGSIFDLEISVQYKPTEGGWLVVFLRDITERKRVENELRASQQIIKGIINAIPVRVFWKDKNLVFQGCNTIFARDAGFDDPKDIIGKDDYQMVWYDQAELYRSDDLQVIKSGCSKLFIEEPQTTPEGHTITLLTSKIPLRSYDGEISGVLGTYMDITDRKQAEDKIKASLKEKEVLLKEIQHRVKNNLLTISGILSLQSEQIKDNESKDAFVTSMNRINAMTKIHTRLYQSDSYSLIHFKGYMEELLGELSRSYGFPHENLIINIQDISLDVNTAIPTGLILNELVSNAMKHAFPDGRKGQITITLSSENTHLILTISDNGIGLPSHIDLRNTESVGLSLLKQLVEQINGTIELVRDKGTRFIVTFSID